MATTFNQASVSDTKIATGKNIQTGTIRALRDNLQSVAEGGPGAHVARSGWHPFDMTNVGTGTGLIYDFDTDGPVQEFQTPDFEDGYEYMLHGYLDAQSTDLTLQAQRVSDSAWADLSSDDSIAGTNNREFWFEYALHTPRRDDNLIRMHVGRTVYSGVSANSGQQINGATTFKMAKARLLINANPTAGKIYCLRRREYETA